MKKATLIRGTSKECANAKKVLRECNIAFREVYSSSSHHTPSLITSDSAFAYKGYNSIHKYAQSSKSSSKK